MLSIIIPTFNEENYLPLILSSIQKQDFRDYEIIVADFDSEDKTVEIAKRQGCKVVRGGLPAKGRNKGARAAAGDLLLFLDAEVILPENFLHRALQEFKKRNLDVAGCGLEPIEEEWMPKFLFPKFGYDLLYNWPIRFLENVFPYAASFILVKREVHEKLGGFDESIKISEDHNYVRRASQFGRFGILRFSKLLLFLRRFQREGILKISWKYIVCNLFNISIGDVRTDILRYHFGQYKKKAMNKENFKNSNFLLQFLWIIIGASTVVIALSVWLIVFLFFSPKLIALQIKRAFVLAEKNELFSH